MYYSMTDSQEMTCADHVAEHDLEEDTCKYDWVASAIGPPPSKHHEEAVSEATPHIRDEWAALARQKAIATERRAARRAAKQAAAAAPSHAAAPRAQTHLSPAASCLLSAELRRRTAIETDGEVRLASIEDWARQSRPHQRIRSLVSQPAGVARLPAVQSAAQTLPPSAAAVAAAAAAAAVAASVSAVVLAVEGAEATRMAQTPSEERDTAPRSARHREMIAFENIATNQAVKELNEQELLLLAKREENGRKVAQLKWQLALNKLQATLTHHTFVVEDNPPGYEKLLENSELWRAKHEKEARGEHVPMTHELLHLPAVTKRVMRMIHTLAHDEATRRGVIEAESSRTCARLELQLMVIVTTYEEGVPEDSTLAVERAARVTRDSVRSAEAEAFASLVEYAQVDGHYAAGRCEARRGYERELVEALVEDEAAGRTVGVARGETCARDVVRSDFMVGVRNLTSIWLFKTINAEVHARWAVEGDEQTVFDDLFEDSSGQAIVAHRNSERDALPPHGVVELEEAGWRRLLVSEGAAALRLLRTAYAAAAPWRGLLRSECTGRRGLEEQGALAASRMHCDLMDSVQWNLAAHRASTPAGSPWDAVEVVHQPPLSEGPEVLDALISESTHSLLDQWYCRSLPENAVSQPAVPPAIEHEDVSGPEGAAAAQKPDEVAPVVASWTHFARHAQKVAIEEEIHRMGHPAEAIDREEDGDGVPDDEDRSPWLQLNSLHSAHTAANPIAI